MPALAIARSESACPGLSPALLRFLRLQNPFYLLSAFCMLAGCWLLAGSVTGAEYGARLTRVWTLAGLLNLYEFMLIGLAVYLVRRRGLERDGGVLLLIEMVFLADATNLCSESWSLGVTNGLLMNGAALALAVAKAAIVIRGLRLRPSPRAVLGLAVAVLVLLGAPGVLAALNRTGMSMELPIHGQWWLVSIATLAVFFLLRGQGAGRESFETALGRNVAFLLLGSFLIHTIAASWVYAAGFHASHLAPFLAVLTVISWRMAPGQLLSPKNLALARAGLPLAAAIFGAFFPSCLAADLPWLSGIAFSPLRGVMVALSVAYLWDFLARNGRRRVVAAATLFLLACSGHSVTVMVRTWLWFGSRIVPRTVGQWGAVALAAAFLLLAAGAGLSLARGEGAGGEDGQSDV
jgi:hypothetical protein